MDCSLPGFSAHGIFQARVLEWGAITFSAGKFSVVIILKIRKDDWHCMMTWGDERG